MPARSEVRVCTCKLEKCIDDATRKNNFQSLEQLLQTEDCDNISHKCSKQFFSKFDKLICRELDRQEVNNVSTLLNSLKKYGKNIIMPGGEGLPAIIKYDLVEKAKEILIFRGYGKNEALTSLIEDFFDVLMLVHDTNNEGKIQTLESFVLRICTLVADVRINIYIQQEAVRKLNSMLDTMSREARKKIISTKEMLLVMNDMGKRILDAGDYDLQVAITEALCRMTSEKQRGELARQWFSMEFVTNAFKGIKDSEFETDCRKFLNQVNGILGDKRRVFTYPCLSAILDKHELQIPLDENLEEFWIDFNVGSRSISFYIAADDENHQWETVSIPEEEVEMYSIEEKESKKLLTIILKNPVTVGNQEGKQIFLYFDPVLEIMEVARKVYGANICKGFTKKQAISVAKTSVHIIFDESGSQVLVPESQLSPCLKEKSGMAEKSSKSEKQQLPVQQRNQNKKTKQENCKNTQFKITTPSKRKVSEASVIVPGTGGLPLRSPLVFVNTSTPRKTGFKLPLQMMSSSEKKNVTGITESGTKNLDLEHTGPRISSIAVSLKRSNVATKKGREGSVLDSAFCETQQNTSKTRIRNEAKLSEKHMPAEKVLEMIQNEADSETSQKQMLDELLDIVPDSQPVGRNDKLLLPGLLESSADETKIWKKQTCSVSEMLITKCDNQKRSTSSGHTFQQVPVLSERAAKQKAFYSIFESTSPKRQAKSRKIPEKHLNETRKTEENYTIDRRQTLNSSKHSDQKILSTEAKEVPTTSETSFKSAHPTKMTEKSLVYSTESMLARDSKEEVGISFRKGTTNHKKSENAKSKEMAETTELIISKISDRYKQKDDIERAREVLANNRSYLNKSGFKANKEKVQNRSFRNVKTTAVLNITTSQIVDDVYNFNLSGFDEPTIKLGIQELHVTELNASTDLTEKMNPDGNKSAIQKKVDKNRTNKNKKHLFSDTDTEYRGDDSKTDISWLRESNKKPKPQLIDYSRTKNLKKSKNIEATGIFPDPAHLMDISEGKKTKNKKVSASKKRSAKTDERIKETTRPKLARRAAALAKKRYKDYSNSESESEQESSECLCRTEKLRVQQEHKNGQNNAMNQQKELQNNVSTEPKNGISRNQQKIFTKSKDPIRQRKLEMSPLSSPESPASIETMRCAEKGPEEAFAQEHVSLKRSTSSYLQDSTREKRESLSIVKGISANKLHTIKKNNQSIHLKESPENVKELVFRNESLSPVLSPLSLPSLTPVTMDKAVMSEKDTEVSEPEVETYINEAVNVTNYLSDKLSIVAELKDLIKNTQNKGEESVPPSPLCTSSGSREQSWCEEPCGTIHESGPTVQVNLKRMYHCDAESDSDEVKMRKEEEEERKTKLLPRKLFKADDDTTYKGKSIMQCARTHSFSRKGKKWSATNEISVSESISTVSVNELSVLDGEFCEPGCSNVGISQKLHKEFTRKIQSRSRRMDHFTKQSLKTAQHHLTSVGCQLHECRIKQLDKFHFTIVKELESFEKDSQSLKNMEKELLNFWKKHACTFSACKKNEQQRIQILKTSFEKYISHSVNYEENIFTSEMHLMKEDMKGLQEKLLKEMVDLLILIKDFLPAKLNYARIYETNKYFL